MVICHFLPAGLTICLRNLPILILRAILFAYHTHYPARHIICIPFIILCAIFLHAICTLFAYGTIQYY